MLIPQWTGRSNQNRSQRLLYILKLFASTLYIFAFSSIKEARFEPNQLHPLLKLTAGVGTLVNELSTGSPREGRLHYCLE